MSKKRILRLTLTGLLLTGSLYLSAGEGTVPDPDPARFQDEINLFLNWDRQNSWPEQAILFVGSSSIRMWQTREGFPDYPVINRGFGGAHTSDVNHYYEQVVKPYKAVIILLYAGDNDIAGDKSPEQVFEDYLTFVKRVKADNPSTKVVFIPIKPSRSRWNFWPRMQETNRLVEAFNESDPELFYLDLATPLLNSEGMPDPSLFLDDSLHLSMKGYAAWESLLKPLLKALYKKEP